MGNDRSSNYWKRYAGSYWDIDCNISFDQRLVSYLDIYINRIETSYVREILKNLQYSIIYWRPRYRSGYIFVLISGYLWLSKAGRLFRNLDCSYGSYFRL